MGTFGEYIKSAISSIRNNKGRSFLTMLGIIIGIAAVLTVLVIGDGMRATINGELNTIGTTTITVSLDVTKTDKFFSAEQLRTIGDNIDNIYGVSPSSSVSGEVVGAKSSYDAYVSIGTEAMEHNGTTTMVHGRYFTRDDVDGFEKVCVLSQIAADKLFGYEEVVGKNIELTVNNMTTELRVVGVRENTQMDTAYASFSPEDIMLTFTMPYTTACDVFNYNLDTQYTSYVIYLDSEFKESVSVQAKAVTENVLGIRGEGAVKVSTSGGFEDTTNAILNIITSVVAIIAAISLLVGGIGVMNIMTVSVTERTREIGIRKSLGARTASILTQFLAEAAILTFTGGIIGIIIGLSLAYLICQVVGFNFAVNPVLVVIVVAISTAIGLFFGIYPARRAAKLDPIEALRTE